MVWFSVLRKSNTEKGSGVLRTRGVFDLTGREGCTKKVTSEQIPKGGEGGSPGTGQAKGTASAKVLEWEPANVLEEQPGGL